MAEGVIVRNINTSFVGKDAGLQLPIRKVRIEGGGNRTIQRSEGL